MNLRKISIKILQRSGCNLMNKGIEKATRESRMAISTNMEKKDDIIEINGRYNGRLYSNA